MTSGYLVIAYRLSQFAYRLSFELSAIALSDDRSRHRVIGLLADRAIGRSRYWLIGQSLICSSSHR